MEIIDDLLGPAPSPQAPVKARRRRKARASKKVDDLLGKRKYTPLATPRAPAANGIFARREEKGKNLGRTCLIDNVELKHKKGRPPVICRKKSCFRAYRNLYRHDYDKARKS